jgi:hypothetical protein
VHLRPLAKELEPPADLGTQHVGVEWLLERIDLAGVSVRARQLGDVDVVVPRDEEDGRTGRSGVLPDEGCGRIAIEPRHAHVHDDGRKLRGAGPLDGVRPGFCAYDSTVERLEHGFERQQVAGIIVDDKNWWSTIKRRVAAVAHDVRSSPLSIRVALETRTMGPIVSALRLGKQVASATIGRSTETSRERPPTVNR